MFIGIDLGGTKIAAGLVDSKGRIRKQIRRPTEKHRGKKHILDEIRGIVDELADGKRIRGVGIGIPGVAHGNRIAYLTNIPVLNGVDLKRALNLRYPVAFQNDARCFTEAEHRHGAGKGTKDMVGITLGTGLGTGAIVRGKLLEGANNYAVEADYQIANPETLRKNPKAKHRFWEPFLSGPGIQRRHRRRGGEERYPSEIWKGKTKAARYTLDETARMLAVYVANLSLVLDPELIVFGGSVAGAPLLKAARPYLKEYLKLQGKPPRLVLSKLKESAGIIGAVEAVKDKL